MKVDVAIRLRSQQVFFTRVLNQMKIAQCAKMDMNIGLELVFREIFGLFKKTSMFVSKSWNNTKSFSTLVQILTWQVL